MKKYKEYLNFEKSFNDFLREDIGKNSYEKYKQYVENIKPRNIYTSKLDILERYRLENFFINITLELLEVKYNISRIDIIEVIKEIKGFYPFQAYSEYYYGYMDSNINTDVNFKRWLKNSLEEFFKEIDQREYGEYYTPEKLIKLSFQNVNLDVNNTVVDPACGSGFFILEYLEELKNRGLLHHDLINNVKNKIYGFDIFPFSIIMSKILLGEFFVRIKNNKSANEFLFENITIHNTVSSLKCMERETRYSDLNFDLIIGNPPFFRIEPNDKNEICNCVSYGHNYIHSIFIHWAIQHLKENGRSILFLPQSILSGFYYQKLRKELLEKCNLDMIVSDKAHEKSFLVQQDIMILYFSKQRNSDNYRIGIPNHDFTIINSLTLPFNLTNNKNRVIPVFKNGNELIIAERLAQFDILNHIDDFEIGTGNFVWNQNKEAVFYSYTEGSVPLIMGPSVNLEGITLNESKFNYCFSDNKKFIRNDSVILYRRMSPIGNDKRMIATIIDTDIIPEYVLENHVNYIKHINNDSQKNREMLQFITNKDFNLLIDNFCQTNQVSSNDLYTIFEALVSLRR